MKRTFGLAAGAFLFAVGCGGADADASSRTPFNALGQQVSGDNDDPMGDVTPVTGPVEGKLGGKAFTGTLTVRKFVADAKNTLFVVAKLSKVTGLDADAAKKLEGTEVKLPLFAQPDGGFPTDGSEVFCENINLYSKPAELTTAAGALSLGRFDVDFATTPGTGVVIAQFACLVPDLLTTNGGGLVNLPDETAQNLVILLNGIVDPLGVNADTDTGSDAADASTDSGTPSTGATTGLDASTPSKS